MLQLIKEISTSNGVPFVFLPLSVIIAVTMLKDIAEDHGRHKSDSEENNKQTKVFKDGKFLRSKWRDIRVGDVILVTTSQLCRAYCYYRLKRMNISLLIC